ncbi:hypothetical protein GN244_ATG06009 [Phytophthora infestans]|uniref:Uncharacterized protein n=1 Tax=Phytophthora infestans TaxID=4787 RepID=A0A833WHF8_PHYIN|nr:hypothetical protein GN244_ATG06009 [Phytophthora infestans]KAF4135288.1 hypothetical protein GN958_ATG15476 [Phytophthora infestans]
MSTMATIRSKNWDHGEIDALIQRWRDVANEPRENGEFSQALNQRIYALNKSAVDEHARTEKTVLNTKDSLRVTDLSENVFKTIDSLFNADHVAQPVLLMASGPLHEANDSYYTNSDAYYTDSAAADASPTKNSGGSAAPPKETSSVCGKRK